MPRIHRSLVILSLLTASAYAAPPPTDPIAIDVAANGSGCRAGTGAVSVAMSSDNTEFTVTYDPFLAQVGLGAQSVDFRKSCALSVQLHVPPGFTYAVDSARYGGFASLAAGASASARTSYSFQGLSPTTLITHAFSGPLADEWQAVDTIDIASLQFAPCGAQRNLTIIEDLRANVGTSDPKATTSFLSLEPPVTYHLTWKRCP